MSIIASSSEIDQAKTEAKKIIFDCDMNMEYSKNCNCDLQFKELCENIHTKCFRIHKYTIWDGNIDDNVSYKAVGTPFGLTTITRVSSANTNHWVFMAQGSNGYDKVRI